MSIAVPNQFLSSDLIDRCGQRAAAYDRDNKFFSDDFEELKNAGFLKLNIPKEFGGLGNCVAWLTGRLPPRSL